MDNNSIATLLDYQASIERSFKKIEKMLGEFDSSEASQQNLSISNMNKELLNIKNNIWNLPSGAGRFPEQIL